MRNITRDKEEYFIFIMGSIHQEYKILNVHAPFKIYDAKTDKAKRKN